MYFFVLYLAHGRLKLHLFFVLFISDYSSIKAGCVSAGQIAIFGLVLYLMLSLAGQAVWKDV